MKVLSFDVGIINLAYCIFDSETCKLVSWEVITLPDSSNYSMLYINLIKELDKRQLLNVEIVLIEKQPSFNPKMRIVAGCLQTYFFIRGVVDLPEGTLKAVEFFSPKHKLKCYTGPDLTINGGSKYTQTKKKGVLIARSKLNEFNESLEFKKLFETSKKKDDLSDCYLQAITYCIFKKCLKNGTNVTTEPSVVVAKVTKIDIKRGILEYLQNQTAPVSLEFVNEFPQDLKNKVISKYQFSFPMDSSNLNVLFGDLSLKKWIKI
jgi:hypothetical protein